MSKIEEVSKATVAVASAGEKLLGTIETATKGIFKPRQMIRVAKAGAKVMDILSEAQKRNPELVFSYKTENIEVSTALNGITQRAIKRMVVEEIQKQLNIETILSVSYENLKDVKANDKQNLSDDWILRFLGFAENISDEFLQKLWAKILAGEFVHPKSYALRTLNLLSTLTSKDIDFIKKVFQFVIKDGKEKFIYNSHELLRKFNIRTEDIFYLQELGLIISTHTCSLDKNISAPGKIILSANKLALTSNTSGFKLSIPVYTLTKLGEEFYSLLSVKLNKSYFMDVCKDLKKHCSQTLSLYPISIIKNRDYIIDTTKDSIL